MCVCKASSSRSMYSRPAPSRVVKLLFDDRIKLLDFTTSFVLIRQASYGIRHTNVYGVSSHPVVFIMKSQVE